MSILLNKNIFLNHKLFFISLAVVLLGGLLFWLNPSKEINNQSNMDNQINEKVNSNEVVKVTLKTNVGDIVLDLYPNKAPKTVENFITLAESGFYNGTKFHRVIKDFMIQGGDPLSKDDSKRMFWGTGGPDYKFDDESNDLILVRGVIAMANAGPDTNGSQFFIVTADATPWLQGKHTGFGKVVSGMEVVDKIEETETGTNDQPVSDMIINEVTISL